MRDWFPECLGQGFSSEKAVALSTWGCMNKKENSFFSTSRGPKESLIQSDNPLRGN
jgi:hypothetical protein